MKDQKGQALVELAVALPLVLVLLCGMVDFGRLVHLKSTLTNAARAGARMAAVTSGAQPEEQAVSLTGSPVAQAIAKTLKDAVPPNAPINYQLRLFDKDDNPVTAAASQGDQVQVTVSWLNPPLITPLYQMLALLSGSPASSWQINVRGAASMCYE